MTPEHIHNLIPIALFFSIAWAIKIVIEARMRHLLLNSTVGQEHARTVLENEESRRRHSSLRWGLILTALAIGFLLIELFDWREATPGAIAVLLAATGLGNLAYFFISRRLQ